MKNFRTPPPDPKNWEQVIEKLEELHDRGLTISMMNPRRWLIALNDHYYTVHRVYYYDNKEITNDIEIRGSIYDNYSPLEIIQEVLGLITWR